VAVRPTLARERAAWAEEHLLVGVDEAGRGPLAGPVVAAAVVFPPGCAPLRGLRDSKLLPAPVRERLAERIRRGKGIERFHDVAVCRLVRSLVHSVWTNEHKTRALSHRKSADCGP
jgi:ribonuclease HII